jgi:archaellum component FlaG (FlaF/FlaG flagellin family)
MLLGEIDHGQYADNGSDDQANDGMNARCFAELLEGPILTTTYDVIDAGPDAIEIWVENGYPFFHCYVETNVKNAGTVPIYVAPLDITNVSGTLEPDVTVETQDCWAQPIQLHPGQAATEMYPNCRVHIQINQSVPEQTVFNFEGSILAWQWNE